MAELFTFTNFEILIWLLFIIVFIIAELISVGLTSIWFAAGSLVALIASAFGAPVWAQILLFVLVSVALLFATRPWAKKFINSRAAKTNAESIIGDEIRIAEPVNNINQTGMAVVRGQEWTVRAEDDKMSFEAGEMAKVVEISGVKLIVTKLENVPEE